MLGSVVGVSVKFLTVYHCRLCTYMYVGVYYVSANFSMSNCKFSFLLTKFFLIFSLTKFFLTSFVIQMNKFSTRFVDIRFSIKCLVCLILFIYLLALLVSELKSNETKTQNPKCWFFKQNLYKKNSPWLLLFFLSAVSFPMILFHKFVWKYKLLRFFYLMFSKRRQKISFDCDERNNLHVWMF